MIFLREVSEDDFKFLFEILKERDSVTNFSNNNLPDFEQHVNFIKSNPYHKWYVIEDEKVKVGTINLDKENGIGTFILKKHQNKGYGINAIKELIKSNPRKKYYANINPENHNSIKLYTKCGFEHLYNHYELKNKTNNSRL